MSIKQMIARTVEDVVRNASARYSGADAAQYLTGVAAKLVSKATELGDEAASQADAATEAAESAGAAPTTEDDSDDSNSEENEEGSDAEDDGEDAPS